MMDKEKKRKILGEMGEISEEFYNTLVCQFIADTRKQIAKLKEAVTNNDYANIAASAHFIKGSSGNLRLHEIYNIAKSIEAESTGAKSGGNITRALKKLEEAVALTKDKF